MNKNLKIVLIVGGVVILATALLFMGAFIGRRVFLNRSVGIERMYGAAPNQHGPGGAWGADQDGWRTNRQNDGRGMFGPFLDRLSSRGFGMGFNWMDSGWGRSFTERYGMGHGRMWNNYTRTNVAENPASLEQIQASLEEYLAELGNPDLVVREIMRFENNSYAVILEKSSGMGAMELLIDPFSLRVFPEYGPSRMWNIKYGMMTGTTLGFGRKIGCGSGFGLVPLDTANDEMELTKTEAAALATEYLNEVMAGVELEGDGVTFYGYYTFDYQQDGKPAGMLSVNGSSGQIWLHTWHGTFLDEWEAMDESEG